MDNMKHRRLQELKRSDFEVVEGEPDIRGWDVRLSNGKQVGEVEELIVDAKNKKVRYMVVDLDDNELDLDDRKVLIPIGMATLHQKDDDVLLPAITVDQLRQLPEYDEDKLDNNVERNICSVFGRSMQSSPGMQGTASTQGSSVSGTPAYVEGLDPEPDFYKHDYYNDDNLYRQRLNEAEMKKRQDSDFDKGLRLWEKRSQGGIIADNTASSGTGRSERSTYREERVEDESLMHVRNNRNRSDSDLDPRQNMSGSSDKHPERNRDMDQHSGKTGRNRRDNTIEGRIKDEGLQ